MDTVDSEIEETEVWCPWAAGENTPTQQAQTQEFPLLLFQLFRAQTMEGTVRIQNKSPRLSLHLPTLVFSGNTILAMNVPLQGSRQSAIQSSWQPKLTIKTTNYNSLLRAIILQ